VVAAVVAMRVMKVAGDAIIHVVAVRHPPDQPDVLPQRGAARIDAAGVVK
jgi:hypothetical protein